ncbi:hypothetical protein LF817_16175 [Halobacillus sp. A1]|uniref:hypothetical protein n=1 Tax=Halobacillus sp. A1 TaxID=2880262 RepID=UPI0020A6A4BE|nr:hypothetical protein [Halobacillus sp. A1]MCP3032864.1 hypothetical protein [Halobacillus sp. A1]
MKRGCTIEKEKNGKVILLTIGWLSALLALGFFPVFLGAVAISMGVVLKRDYDVGKQGTGLIVAGIIGMIVGTAIGILVPW